MKALFIIAQKDFRDEELFETKDVLNRKGIESDVASVTTNIARGMLGGSITPNLAVRDAKESDYSALIVVGGSGSPELANHREVLELIKQFFQKNKLIAAICLAPMVLAKAGVLKDIKATVWNASSYQDSVKVLQAGRAKFATEVLVKDKNIITAFGPEQAEKFGEMIVKSLKG